MACININHPEYKKLLTELEKEGLTNQVNIQGIIHQYQEVTGTDIFPPIDYLLAKLLGKTWEVKVANENEFNKVRIESIDDFVNNIKATFSKITDKDVAHKTYLKIGIKVHPDKGVYPTEYFQKLQDEYDEWKRINLGINESETFEDIWEKMSSEEKAVWIDMELEMQKLKKRQAEAQAAKNKQDTRRNNELTERIRLENISTGILTGSWESLDKETMLWGIETGRIKLSHFIAKHENPIIQSLYSIIERDVWDKIPIKLNNEPNPKHRGSVATDAIGQIYDITIYTNGVFNSSTDQFSGTIFANVVAHETIHKFTLALLYGDMKYLTSLGFKEESILKSRKELDDIYKIAKDTYTGNFSSIKYALSNMAEFVAGFVDKPAFVGLLHYASNYVETTERIPITTEYDKNFVEALLDRIHEWIVRLFNPNFKINPKKTKTIYESQTVTKEEPLYNRYVKAVEDLFSLQNQVGPDSQLQTTNLLGYTGDITNRFTKLYGDDIKQTDELIDYIYDNIDFLKLDTVMLRLLEKKGVSDNIYYNILSKLASLSSPQLYHLGADYNYKNRIINIFDFRINEEGTLIIVPMGESPKLSLNTLYEDSPELYKDIIKELLSNLKNNNKSDIFDNNKDFFNIIFKTLANENIQDSFSNTILGYLTNKLYKIKPKRINHVPGLIKLPNDAKVAGIYLNLQDNVVLSDSADSYILLHEIVHKFTAYPFNIEYYQNSRLDPFEEKYVNKINELYNYALDHFNKSSNTRHYGLSNPKEFIAEALSNQNFAAELANIEYKGNIEVRNKYILDMLYDAIYNFLKAFFRTVKKDNLLEVVLGVTVDFIESRVVDRSLIPLSSLYSGLNQKDLVDDKNKPFIPEFIKEELAKYLDVYKQQTKTPSKEGFKMFLKKEVLINTTPKINTLQHKFNKVSEPFINFNQYFPDYSYLTDEEKEVFLRGVESGDLSINCTI